MNGNKILEFKVDLSPLSKENKEVVKILKNVGKLVHKIWFQQMDPKTGEYHFYPKGVTRGELRDAAKKDKNILSPYTIVERVAGGKLVARNYSDVYRKDIEKICHLLDRASKVTKESKFAEYLRTLVSSYRRGDYQRALVAFLTNDHSTIDILMGPIESYNDSLMGVKRTFQFSLRVLKKEETAETEEMGKLINRLSILRPLGSISKETNPDKIFVRVDDVIMFSGRQVQHLPASTNLPNDPDLLRRYGARVVVYNNALYKKYDQQLKPLMKFVKGFNVNRTKTAGKEAWYRMVVLHEIAEGVLKYPGMDLRMGEYIDVMRELNAELSAMAMAKYYVLSGMMTVDQYNELLANFVIYAVNTLNRVGEVGSLFVYARGFGAAINYMMKTGAIVLNKKRISFNFVQMSADVDALSSVIASILQEGTANDAEKFLKEWEDTGLVEKLPKP